MSESNEMAGKETGRRFLKKLQKEFRNFFAKEMLKAHTSHLLPCKKPLLLHTRLTHLRLLLLWTCLTGF